MKYLEVCGAVCTALLVLVPALWGQDTRLGATGAALSKTLQQNGSTPNSFKEKLGYIYGLQTATNTIRTHGDSFDRQQFVLGLIDAFDRRKARLTATEMEEILATVKLRNEQARQRRLAEQRQAGEANKEKGAAFLAKNAKKKGVVTRPSGLQYKILTNGTGARPTLNDTVRVHYHGRLVDGTVFDSSVTRGVPVDIPVRKAIAGWQEGVLLMPVGAKYRLYIPAQLAYGSQARGILAPHSTLVYDLELLAINPH